MEEFPTGGDRHVVDDCIKQRVTEAAVQKRPGVGDQRVDRDDRQADHKASGKMLFQALAVGVLQGFTINCGSDGPYQHHDCK